MAPSDEYGGDSDVDDGFDDDVPGVGGSGCDDQQEDEENPFTAFAEAHAKAARRRARTPDIDGNGDAAMQDIDLGSDADCDDDDDDDGDGGGLEVDDDGGDSTNDDIEDVTPAQSAASSEPTLVEPKYGGSVRKRAAGWGDEGGGASRSDDETAIAANINMTHTQEDDEDGGSDATGEDEPFGNALVRAESKDSAYEDDDDDGVSEGSSASEDPAPFAKYTGEAEEEDEENPFEKYASGGGATSTTRRAARRREDDELVDDLFSEDTAAGGRKGQDGGHGGGGGGGGFDGFDDDDGFGPDDDDDDDDDESPRNAKSKDSGAGTTPTGMITYDQDFEDADDYDLDGLDGNYDAIKAYEKRRGMLTNRQWAVVLAIITCIFVLLMIIIGLSVALASRNQKNGGDDQGTHDGSIIDDGKFPPGRPHVISRSYLQTYSGQDIETMESTAMIKQYENLMGSYLTYYIGGGVGEDDTAKALEMGSVAALCTVNFQRLSSTATRKRRHNSGGGGRRDRRQRYRGLRRRRTQFRPQQGAPVPQEVLDAVNEIGDGTLEISGAAPTFYDDGDDTGEQPSTANTSPKPMCPPGMDAVRGSNGRIIGCSPSRAPPTSETKPTSAAGTILPERPTDSDLPAIATATVLDMMATEEEEDSMHLEIDFTMTWSAPSYWSSQGDDYGNKLSEADDKGLRELQEFPKHFEAFMNSQRGKRQQLHDLTKVLELDVEFISDVVEREPLQHKFTDVPTVSPTPAPFAAASPQPTPEDGCCFGVCWFSC